MIYYFLTVTIALSCCIKHRAFENPNVTAYLMCWVPFVNLAMIYVLLTESRNK